MKTEYAPGRSASPVRLSTTILLCSLLFVGIGSLAAGIAMNTWWTIAGGVVALTGAAWLVTEPS